MNMRYRRGSNTMKMLAIRFKIMDDDGKGGISPAEFQKVRPKGSALLQNQKLVVLNTVFGSWQGMLEFGIPVSNEATMSLFEYYSSSGGPKDGQELNFDQFIIMMRGYLNPQRRNLVHRAFRKMDKDGSGVVDWHDLKDVYNVAQHPKVLTGKFPLIFESGRHATSSELSAASKPSSGMAADCDHIAARCTNQGSLTRRWH